MTTRVRTTSALAAVAVLALSGCGAKQADTPAAAGTPLTKANFASAMKTSASQDMSAHMEGEVKMEIDPSAMGGMGDATDVPSQAMSVKVGLKGDTRVTGGKPEMQMTMDIPAMDMGGTKSPAMSFDMRVVKDVMYVKMPNEMAPMLNVDAGKFMKIDLTGDSALAKSFQKQMGSATLSDTYKPLTEGVKDVKHEGTETVDGVATNKYTVTVSTEAAMKAAGGMGDSTSTAGLPKEIPVQVWIDKDNKLRREVVNMSVQGLKMSMDMRISKYGEAVNITAPPASQVVDAPKELMDGMSAGMSTAAAPALPAA